MQPAADVPVSEGAALRMFTSRHRIPTFDLVRPRTVDEIGDVYRSGAPWRFMAGGVDLKREMKIRADVTRVVDVRGVDELRRIDEHDDGSLWVGAAVTHAQFASSPAVQRRYPGLDRIWAGLGNVRVRHVGTLVGNVVAGLPQYHARPVLASLDAELVLYDGQRRTRGPLDATTLARVSSDGLCVLGVVLPRGPRRCALIRDFVPTGSVAVSTGRDGNGAALVSVVVAGRAGLTRRTVPVGSADGAEVASTVARDLLGAGGDASAAPDATHEEHWVTGVAAHRIRRFLASVAIDPDEM